MAGPVSNDDDNADEEDEEDEEEEDVEDVIGACCDGIDDAQCNN